jgi:hypothetical protein
MSARKAKIFANEALYQLSYTPRKAGEQGSRSRSLFNGRNTSPPTGLRPGRLHCNLERGLVLHVVDFHQADANGAVFAAHDRGVRPGFEIGQDDG